MTTIHEVNADQLIKKAAEELKKLPELKPPRWAAFVKTGMHKERPPVDPDWWYIRAAAVLRKIALLGPVGVSKLRTKFGGRKRRGHKPEHFYKGSGNIIRKILQALEKAGLIKQAQKGVHKGRILTVKGNSFLLNIVSQITGKPIARKEKKKKEKPEKEKAEKEEKPKKKRGRPRKKKGTEEKKS